MVYITTLLLFTFLILPLIVFLGMLFEFTGSTEVDCVGETLVVLGNKSQDGKPSEDMQVRVKHLVQTLRKHKQRYTIVLTGSDNEPDLMYALLTKSFTEEELAGHNIVFDEKSVNTIQSFQFLKDNGFSPCYVLTSAYHRHRTAIIAKKVGVTCTVVPAVDNKLLVSKFVIESYFVILTWLLPISFCQYLSKVRIALHLK